jgi:Uma2 family endonuclease
MSLDEIVLPETKPESEWVRGRALQKMSPQRDHGRVQMRFASALDVWSQGRGEVATEWRFRIAVPGEPRRPLVPDVAFVAYERLRGCSVAELQAPEFAPTVAVEILSPGDDPRDVASKIDAYLRGGSDLVLVLDPNARTLAAHDAATSRRFRGNDDFEHPVLPDFALALAPFFEAALQAPD